MTDEQREQRAREGRGKAGGVAVGRFSGGAIATGDGSRAEDRSERVGQGAERGTGPVAVPLSVPEDGGVAVGEMTGGAVATGPDAEAVDSSRQLLSASPELLAAVRLLRQQLPLLARAEGDGLDGCDGQLAELEEEVVRTGRAERGRLVRLRALLTGGATTAGGLASAIAVVQAISGLLG
ncbi:hypothetical protein ACH4U6_26015 [Streptomyces netropsis]|uniref:Uncharacterized protein n=1 Tax=Streptomyces netropsis TaxID=55404 RepID=A0A7W7PF49_STRNE|nr:hypothetical protein [Streptomyces netropsis]MBB4886280.1 hypothetical protein [Streptomyces netropsis]GGR15148.1 hypothetical protein GCM10010219_20060 [Streptomyces netropsis]